MNPLKLNDIFRANIRLIRGSNPTGSIALVCYVTEFAATAAFPDRTKIYNGTPSEILDAMEADGFVATDRAYLHAAAFTSIDTPIDEIMIGRRDAGDASWTATLDAIEAEDDSFGLFIVDTTVKTEVLQASAWAQTRWKFLLTASAETGALTSTAGTLVADLFALKRTKTACCWYDPEEATNYGPAVIDTEGAPTGGYGVGFSILNGLTLILTTTSGDTYDGYERTITFASTAATQISSGFTTGLADAETILMEVDDAAEITITLDDDTAYFPDGIALATAAQVVDFLTDYAPTVTWSTETGEIRATSQRPGSSSKIEFTGGTALATLGFSVASASGTGDFAFADTATATELATKIDAAATGAVQVTVGTMSFNGTDDVGLTVDGLDVFVASNTSNAQTLTDLKTEWDGTPAAVALAAMTVDATTVTLTFIDYLEHTVVAYSPATADITGITNSTEAATPLDLDASVIGTKLRLSSLDSGDDVSISIVGGTVLSELGLEIGEVFGEGTTDNFFTSVWAGQIAYLASRLDTPGGSVPWDNMKLPLLGNTLTATQRTNLRNQNCNTYEVRTANYPGELHWGVNTAGFNGDFAVACLLWLPLRLAEQVKSYQDRMTDSRLRVPYSDAGIAQFDAQIKAPFRVLAASGQLDSFDELPFDTTKVTGWYTPTLAQQSAANRAANKVSGWRIVQLDAGSIKAVEIDVDMTSQ